MEYYLYKSTQTGVGTSDAEDEESDIEEGMKLAISGATESYLYPNDIVKLHRFDDKKWTVHYGWYAWGNNREVCGWYLIADDEEGTIKPLQRIDLTDIFTIE